MQRGIIRSYDRANGSGFIGRMSDIDIKFNASRTMGSKADFKQGDSVWFEIQVMQSNCTAINVRKCM